MRLDQLQTPALLVRLDRVRANIAHMLAELGGDPDRWRPHLKTTKIAAVWQLLLDAGIRQFKCATTREADRLLDLAREPIDLLVAFPHQGPNLTRIAALADRHPEHVVSLITEDPDHAGEVRRANARLGLFLDLDPGYHRTGIPLDDRQRIDATRAAAGDALRGLHYYDGHVLAPSAGERRTTCERIYGRFLDLVHDLGAAELELITSGTPTFGQAAAYPPFAELHHRVSPGTVVFSDLRTEELGVDGFARAAHVLSRVVSAPRGDRVTCDAGSKALDAAAGTPCAAAEDWPGLDAQTPSEEHLPMQVTTGPAPARGTLLQLVPRHVCPTVNLADEAVLLEREEVADIVPIDARGHETR